MPPRAGQKEESRARILASAGRGFRSHGFGGLGIDGLARDAGVTSGAFYAHFPSKAAAFQEAVVAGMDALAATIVRLRAEHGAAWGPAFVARYTTERRTCDLADSCALQSLSGEVARADAGSRAGYAAALDRVVAAAAEGMPGHDAWGRATALLALLSGGVTMARAVPDPAAADAIAAAVRVAALDLIA